MYYSELKNKLKSSWYWIKENHVFAHREEIIPIAEIKFEDGIGYGITLVMPKTTETFGQEESDRLKKIIEENHIPLVKNQ